MPDSELTQLDYFSKLELNNKKLRCLGVSQIVKSVIHNSSDHATYLIIKRLIRGLGGSKIFFKQGCYASFVAFLHLLPADFDLKALEEIITLELQPGSGSSKQDEGEAYLGQILAYGAMIDSGFLLVQEKSIREEIFCKIFELSSKKSYLHNPAFTFLSLYVEKTGSEFTNQDIINDLKELKVDTLDKLNYLMTVSEFSKKHKTLKTVLGIDSFFHKGNIKKLVSLMKKTDDVRNLKHIFFSKFVEYSLKYPEFIASFWYTLCEKVEQVKSSTSKEKVNKKNIDALILHICGNFCVHLSDWTLVQEILNITMLSIIIRNNTVHQSLVSSLLENCCKMLNSAPDSVKLCILKRIVLELEAIHFDKLTNTKTVWYLTNSLSSEGIKELAELYRSILDNNGTNKTTALSYFEHLINHASCCSDISWRSEQLAYLLKMGFSINPTVSKEFGRLLQQSFFNSLGRRFPSVEALDEVISELIMKLEQLIASDNCSVTFDEEISQAWVEVISLRKKFSRDIKNNENSVIMIALKIILGYTGLLLLKEPKTAQNNIQDIKKMYSEVKTKEIKKDENEVQWIEVLIDLFLNLLSKPNYHHRYIIKLVFKSLCPQLTERAFCQIVEVIDPSFDAHSSKEDEEGSDESADKEEGESGSEDNSSEEESEEEEDLTTTEKLRQELRNVLTPNYSDVESVDLDDMDEEEGKQLDAKLSEIFRANFKNRKTKGEKKYEVDLSHFKMRVLDLVYYCAEVCLPLSYWFKAVGPLVDLLSLSVSNKKYIFIKPRVSSAIKKLQSSEINLDVSIEETSLLIKDLLQKAALSSGIYPDIRQEIICLVKFVLKSTKSFLNNLKPNLLEKNELYLSVKSCVEDYFKNNNLHGDVYLAVTTIGWDGIYAMLPEFIQFSFDRNLKTNKRIVALQVVTKFFRNPHYFMENFKKYAGIYMNNAKKIFEVGISELNFQEECNNKYISDLLSLLIYLLYKNESFDFSQFLDSENLKKILSERIPEWPSFKGKAKNSLHKLCTMLSISHDLINKNMVMSIKKKADESSDEEDSEVNVTEAGKQRGKKENEVLDSEGMEEENNSMEEDTAKNNKESNGSAKRKRGKDKRKLKKLSKKLRMNKMDEGLQNCTFVGHGVCEEQL